MTHTVRAVTRADLPALFACLGEQLTENGRHGMGARKRFRVDRPRSAVGEHAGERHSYTLMSLQNLA